MSDADKERRAVQMLTNAYKKSLLELVGNIEEKTPSQLVAWSRALIQLEQQMRQALLTNTDLNED